MTTNELQSLTTKQLLTMLRHVQLGDNHLSKILDFGEYRNLLKLGSLSHKQSNQMESDHQEKIGNASMVVNTILTSVFGASLGFSAFSHASFNWIIGLIVAAIAIFFGFSIGYLGYILTHYQAKLAIKKQRLLNIEKLITEILINKYKNRIQTLHFKVHLVLNDLTQTPNEAKNITEQDLIKILKSLALAESEQKISTVYNKIIKRIKSTVHKLNVYQSTKKVQISSDYNEGDFLMNNALTNASFLKILTKVDVVSHQQIPKLQNWIRKNMISLFVGLIPTVLGTFASMFVFLNGVPALFDGLKISFELSAQHILIIKEISLMMAFVVSFYFAYSHIHSNYKAFRRSKLLEVTEKYISEKNNLMIREMAQLNFWLRIYNLLLLTQELHLHFSIENCPTEKNLKGAVTH